MKHVISHGLSLDLAKKATRKALETYKERFAEYNPQVEWQGEEKASVAFGVKGVNLNGDIDINDKDIALDMSVPFLLKPFQKKAVAVVDKAIREWIDRAKNGELDN